MLHGPADATVTIEDAPGGTARSISNVLLNGISVKTIARQAQIDGLGEAWERHIPTGKKGVEISTLEGTHDTTATTGSHAIFNAVDDGPNDDGRELVVNFGGATFTVDLRLMSYEVVAQNDGQTRFRAEVQATGEGVWS